MSKPTQEDLILLLDPDRDYGPIGLAGVIERVRSEEYYLGVVPDSPLPAIRKSKNHMAVKGTSRISRAGANGAGQRLTNVLVAYMEDDGGTEKVIDIVEETLDPDSKQDIRWRDRIEMVQFLADRIIGPAKDQHRLAAESSALEKLLERMAEGTLDEERPIPEGRYTTKELESGE